MDQQQLTDDLPDWLDLEAWEAFKAMRKAKGQRAPFTREAQKRMLMKLDALRALGQDTAAVLWQSIIPGWSDVYLVKTAPVVAKHEHFEVTKTKRLLAEMDSYKTPVDKSVARAVVAEVRARAKRIHS